MGDSSALLLAPLLVSTLLTAIDATGIIFALPNITQDLHGSATESFWISASFLLAMCVSQPILSNLSACVRRKSLILSSFLILGVGSLIVEYATGIVFCLIGRSVQGLGAGGLVVLTYAAYGDLSKPSNVSESRYLSAVTCSAAAGTISGPFIGVLLSDSSSWRWIFRLNVAACVLLGIIVYNHDETPCKSPSHRVTIRDLDFLGAILFIGSIVPLLVGLSLAGSLYQWTDWRALSTIVLGSASSVLFLGRELFPSVAWLPWRSTSPTSKTLLGLTLLVGKDTVITFAGAIFLGFIVFALLFFLPIYFRVVKQHTQMSTALLLLPQTCMILLCAPIVSGLIKHGFCPPRIIVLGWFCTSCGIGLLAMLGADKAVFSDVLLNLLSGFGVGVLLPALVFSAKDCTSNHNMLRALTLLVTLRYLGSALSLVVLAIVFQQVLRRNLKFTKFDGEATKMTKHTTVLMSSIRDMPSSQDKSTLMHATDKTLRTIWIVLAIMCFAVFLLSCMLAVITARRKRQLDEMIQEASESIEEDIRPSSVSKPDSAKVLDLELCQKEL